jgi:hypothetical protein
LKKVFLLVDDEQPIIALFGKAFPQFLPAYKVEAFTSFAEGKEFASKSVGDIGIVLLDGKDNEGNFGWHIAEALREAGSQALIFLLSGDPKSAVPREKRYLFNGIFWKPLRIHEFCAKLQDEWLV